MKILRKLSIVLFGVIVLMVINSCTKEDVPAPTIPTIKTGDATFWIASDLGVGSISITCNGTTQIISGYFSSGVPSCGAIGSANFNLNAGTYPYSAVAGSSTWSGTITVVSGGCAKQQLSSGGSGGGGTSTGDAMFWTASDLGVGSISVTCNGSTKNITGYSSSGTPGCGSSGAANFTLNPGVYPFSASGGSLIWSGTITVASGGCSKQQLTANGSGGGETSTGQAMFWTASDLGVGSISVTCNGSTKSITGYSSSGTPNCGSSGAANFTLNPGTYSYSASGGSLTWNGTISVTNGGCTKMQLNRSASACNYSLNGTWVRQNDGGCPNSTGITVYFSNSQGVIKSTSSNTCGFSNGQVKWKNFNSSSCSIDDLNMPTGNYYSYSVSFVNSSTLKIGSITYIKQ